MVVFSISRVFSGCRFPGDAGGAPGMGKERREPLSLSPSPAPEVQALGSAPTAGPARRPALSGAGTEPQRPPPPAPSPPRRPSPDTGALTTVRLCRAGLRGRGAVLRGWAEGPGRAEGPPQRPAHFRRAARPFSADGHPRGCTAGRLSVCR